MRTLSWLIKALIFLLVLLFALKNQHLVMLYAGTHGAWEAPLVLVMLIALVAGVCLGIVAMLPSYLHQRQTLRHLRATVALQASQRAATTVSPQPDVPLAMPPRSPHDVV